MSETGSDTTGSPFEHVSPDDSNGSSIKPHVKSSTEPKLESLRENKELIVLQEAMEKITKIAAETSNDNSNDSIDNSDDNDEDDEHHLSSHHQYLHHEHSSVPPTTPILSPHPTSVTSIDMHPLTSDSPEIHPVSKSPSLTESTDNGLLGWIANNGFLNRVAEKAKNSVDTMITTLDPGMKEYLYSGGDVNIVVASDKESKIAPVREAFIDVFGRATVKGINSQSSSVASQPVGPEAALRSASERIANLRLNHQYDVPQNQVIVAIESFVTELTPDSWFEMGCLLLEDPMTGNRLVTYSQATPVPNEAINHLKFETPNDYEFKATGYSLTIGKIMGQRLSVSHEDWHEALIGIPRRSLMYLSACGLARLFKDKNHLIKC